MIPAEEPPLLAPGTPFAGKYEIVRIIGRGGMAVVYEAIHVALRKRVAIKVLFPGVARQLDTRARFLREGEAASRIAHPHVVDITDVGIDGDTPYLVMEYLEGEDLAALLAREGGLAVDRTVELLLPVVAAVAAGHRAGVIHRDLKPQNIFLAHVHGELRPKVLDFGVSKLVGADPARLELTGTAAVFGTPAYMSPEQARGAKRVDARSDQYAIGLLLYECVTGRRAHQGANALAVLRDIGDGRLEPPRRHRPDLPPAVEAVVLRALHPHPDGRFASLDELATALLPFATPRARTLWTEAFTAAVAGPRPVPTVRLPARGTETAPSPPTTMASVAAAKTGRPARGGRVRAAVTAAVVVIGGAALWWASSHPRRAVVSPAVEPRTVARPAAPPAAASEGRPVLAPRAVPAATPRRVSLRVEPRTATIELDGERVGTGSWSGTVPRDGRRHRLVFRAGGHRTRTVELGDEPPPAAVVLPRLRRPPEPRPVPDAAPVDDDVLGHRR